MKPASAQVQSVREFLDDFLSRDVLDIVTKLTVIMLIIHLTEIRATIIILCGVAVLFPKVGRSTYFWLLVFVSLATAIFINWHLMDNHIYLIAYWCLTLSLVTAGPGAGRVLHVNARLLIGLCFLFATFWKAVSPDYLSGDFFHFTLLTDPRLESFARLVGGVPERAFVENAQTVSELSGAPEGREAFLQGTPLLAWVAQVLTWLTIVMEGLLALAFLLPLPPSLAVWRHVLLLLFALGTYSIAPVIGFGWVLMIMGLAQCEEEHKWLRLAYIVVFFVLITFRLPWPSFFLS
ncbi:MAG TPA: hypothetical protein VLU25_16955 [Acidobacteriota bacterium]|nr:hypothetical protein [Acidobacteriota bacterium]